MLTEVHTIRCAGKKEIPPATQLEIRLGRAVGTVNVAVKLPGQADWSYLGDLAVVNGVLELPLRLVFFSYAREDEARVVALAERLWRDGFLTWVDRKDLLPGDDWQRRIEDAIERADFVLVFLSEISCAKAGYVHKEMRAALRQAEMKPMAERYIIPVLLEPCAPPRELRQFHWLHLWEDGAFERLKRALA